MKTKTVMVPVEIPVGYDLAEGEQPRYGFNGELALDWSDDGIAGLIGGYSGQTRKKHYILVKEWEPTESDKAYYFGDTESALEDGSALIGIFSYREGDVFYVILGGKLTWFKFCWPIPADMIGE